MKAQRKICGAVKSGARVFEHSNTTLVTGKYFDNKCLKTEQCFWIGCTTHPGDFKYCSKHKNEDTPAVSSTKLHPDNKAKLRSAKEKSRHYQEQDYTDSVYIIEGKLIILCGQYISIP